MLNPYENIIIGNFLYGLGLAMGRHPNGVDGCVNLMQQTPLDPVLGDVMLHFPAVWRLIEFKRVGANMEKEWTKLQLFVGATKNNPHMQAASRLAHWFVLSGPQGRTMPHTSKDVRIQVRPYLDLNEPIGISLEQFAIDIVEQACNGQVTSLDDLDLYLELIATFGGLEGLNTSGLLVGVSGNGGLTYVPVPNIADLRGTASMLRARMERQIEREVSRDPWTFSPEVKRALEAQSKEQPQRSKKLVPSLER